MQEKSNIMQGDNWVSKQYIKKDENNTINNTINTIMS